VVKAAARNSKRGKEIMALLLNRRGGDVLITKGAVAQIVRDFNKEIIALLFN